MGDYCENCGAKILENAQFCPECGSKVLKNLHTCPKCGNDVKDNENFCESCGTKLTEEKKRGGILEEYKIPIIIIATVGIIVLIGVVTLSLTAHNNGGNTDIDYGDQTVSLGNVQFKIPANYRLVPSSIDYGYENFVTTYQQSYSNGEETITLLVMYSPGANVDAESYIQEMGGGVPKSMMGQEGFYNEYDEGYGFHFGLGNKIIMVVVSSPYMFDEITVLG